MKRKILMAAALCGVLVSSQLPTLGSPGTAFTYQGLMELEASGTPVTGLYDFTFNLYNANGNLVNATPFPVNGLGVTNGLFMARIDFGAVFDGTQYWLEIASRTNNSSASFQVMSPRVELTPVPYAIYAETAGRLANNSVAAANIVLPLHLGHDAQYDPALTVLNNPGNAIEGHSTSAIGVSGYSSSIYGVYGSSDSGDGVYGSGRNGVHGRSLSATDSGVWGENPGSGTGVAGSSDSGTAVWGSSAAGQGVVGESVVGQGVAGYSTDSDGVYGNSARNGVHGATVSATDSGVWGENGGAGFGVFGNSRSGTGVQGTSYSGDGVYGQSQLGDGVAGHCDGDGKSGVYGYSSRAAGYGGFFYNSGGGEALHVAGRAFIDGSAFVKCLTINGGCDLAEPFQMSGQDLAKGSVVVIDEENPGHLRLSDRAYDTRVAGIISGANGVNPGVSLSQQGVLEGGQNVALSGRVYVLADASSSPIKPGDLLTASSTPGHAMKVNDHSKAQGAVIGKAMTPLKEGKGMVLVLVTLQ